VQKILMSTGVWEKYEADRSKPAVTKLNRKGYKTGKVAVGVKAEKPVKAAAEAPAAAAAASDGADEAPAEETTEAPVAPSEELAAE